MNHTTSRIVRLIRRWQEHRAAVMTAIFVPLLVACSATAPGQPREQLEAAQWLAERYPRGTIDTVEGADRALAEAAEQRQRIEESFMRERKACFDRFFLNDCIDAAAERRRLALSEVRAVELEANAYKRRARLAERNRALEEKNAQARERQPGERATEAGSRTPGTTDK